MFVTVIIRKNIGNRRPEVLVPEAIDCGVVWWWWYGKGVGAVFPDVWTSSFVVKERGYLLMGYF